MKGRILSALLLLPLSARCENSCPAEAKQQEADYEREAKAMASSAESWRLRRGGDPAPIPVQLQSQGDSGRTAFGEILENTQVFRLVPAKERFAYRLDYRWEHQVPRPIEDRTRACARVTFTLRVYDEAGKFVMDAGFDSATVETVDKGPRRRAGGKPLRGLTFDKAEAMVAAQWVQKALGREKERPAAGTGAAVLGAARPRSEASPPPRRSEPGLGKSEAELLSEQADVYCSTTPADAKLIEKGIQDYGRLLGVFPENADFYAGRGRCHEAKADRRAAQEDFDKAVELEPGNPFMRLERARYRFKVAPMDADEALADIDVAVKKAGDQARVHSGASSLLRYMAGYLDSDWEFADGTRKSLLFAAIGNILRRGQAESRSCLRLLKEGAKERPQCYRAKEKSAREGCLKGLRELEEGCRKDQKALEPLAARFLKAK